MYYRTNNQKIFQTFRFVDYYKVSYINQFFNYLKIEKSIAIRCILTKILKNIIMHSIESKYNARNTLHVNQNFQKYCHAFNRVKIQREKYVAFNKFSKTLLCIQLSQNTTLIVLLITISQYFVSLAINLYF